MFICLIIKYILNTRSMAKKEALLWRICVSYACENAERHVSIVWRTCYSKGYLYMNACMSKDMHVSIDPWEEWNPMGSFELASS